jgi:hypothetical protein
MKLFIGVLLLSSSLSAATIECAKVGRSTYPVSKDAIKLAQHLKLKTCTGKSFKAAVKSLGQTIVMVPASAEVKALVEKTKLNAAAKKLSGFTFN